MQQRLVVVDDFYDDFARVRRAALEADYEPRRRGYYPGRNSLAPHFVAEALPRLSAIAGAPLAMTRNSGSGCFRVTLADDAPDLDIHFDSSELSAVVFLNDEAQSAGRIGTSFWRHKRTGLMGAPADSAGRQRALDEILKPDSHDRSRWELQAQVAMLPNRLLIFQSSLFHAPHERFGTDVADARLIQVFFLVRAGAQSSG